MKKSCYLLLACLFVGMSACISLDIDVELEPVKDLVLSVGNNGHVSTDGLSYEFEVLDGNGGYKATVSKNRFDEDAAKVTINGTKVTVDLLEQFVSITITDQKGETASLNIRTSHESLTRVGYGVSLEEGDSCVMDNISFGAGQYSATLWEELRRGNGDAGRPNARKVAQARQLLLQAHRLARYFRPVGGVLLRVLHVDLRFPLHRFGEGSGYPYRFEVW